MLQKAVFELVQHFYHVKWNCPVVPLAVENRTLMILRESLKSN